jgi:hypothetical protein
MSKQQKIEDTPLLDGEAGKQGTKRKAEESGAQEDKEAAPPTKDAKSDGHATAGTLILEAGSGY